MLDASATVELLLSTPRGLAVSRSLKGPQTLHVPQLLFVEVAQVFRRLTREKVLTPARASGGLDDLRELDADRYDHDDLLPRIFDLRDNHTAYDAVYIALAEVLGATLVTFDRKIARSRAHGARVEVPTI